MSLDNIPPEENPEDGSLEEFRDQYQDEVPEEEEPQASGNRTFITIIGVIGAVVVLTVLALVIYFLISRGQLTNRFQEQAAQINAENTAVAIAATESSLQDLQRMTEKAMLPATWTPTALVTTAAPAAATATPQPTNTTGPTEDANAVRTATVRVVLTQLAQGTSAGGSTAIAQVTDTTAVSTQRGQATPTARLSPTVFRTPTALPQTGFAEDVGLPGMFGMALGLILLVIIVRRIRLASTH